MFLKLYDGQQNKNGFLLLPKLLHPRSSAGNIRLKSQNPFEHPAIEPNYLDSDDDVEVLLDGENIPPFDVFFSICAHQVLP